MIVAFDERFPVVDGFDLKYLYVVNFFQANNWAGNHYHKKKEEIFLPLRGDFLIKLKSVESGICEEVKISASEHHALYIDTKVAHKVMSLGDNGCLLVAATSPNSDGDEFQFEL